MYIVITIFVSLLVGLSTSKRRRVQHGGSSLQQLLLHRAAPFRRDSVRARQTPGRVLRAQPEDDRRWENPG